MHTPIRSRRLHRALCLLLACLLTALPTEPRRAQAAGQAFLSLSAAPEVILADGRSDTTLTATVRDSSGNLAPDGTTVQFATSEGTLSQDATTTLAGTARVRLISAPNEAVANVTATAFVGSAGGATGEAHVEFTTDRELLLTGPDARWIQVECPEYLIYSADVRVIEAQGRHGSARLRYKALSITADALQLDLQTQTLLARNAVMQRGRHTLHADRLRYNLATSSGTAIADVDAAHPAQTVTVDGPNLAAAPVAGSAAQFYTENDIYRFADLSATRLIVAARAMAVDPGKTLQFRRAAIYADGKKVLSMPYQVMPADSHQLFGRQLVGFTSTGGLALDVPFYYHVDPHSTGTLFLRNSTVGGSDSAGALDATGTRPGLALDLHHTYALGAGGSGQVLLTGLTRSDWGAHWDHSQRIGPATSSFFLLDSPTHRTLYGLSQLTRQFTGFSFNLEASGSRDPGQGGYSSSSTDLNVNIEGNPRPLGQTGISLIPSLGWQTGQYIQNAPGVPQQVIPISNRTLEMRLFTAPLHPDARTNVTDGLKIGQSWGSGRSAPTMQLNLGLARTMPMNGSLGMNYTWRYDPLFSQLGTDPTGGGLLGTVYHSPTQQRLSLTYAARPGNRMSLNFSGGYGLPLGDTNLYTSLSYRINNNWGLGLGSFYDRYLGNSYRETLFSVSRRILGRDLVFTYSTLTKKVRFNIAGTTF